MTYSLNETEALCRKAARGAGFGWGEAETAGRAARWLHRQGLPGADVLAKALETKGVAPGVHGAQWGGSDGLLCAIRVGTALADHGHVIAGSGIKVGAVNAPLLLLGFLSVASFVTGRSLEVRAPQGRAVVMKDDLELSGRFAPADCVCVTVVDAPRDLRSHLSRADIPPDVYARLDRFAQLTYAPATEASRLAGAGDGTGNRTGAGRSDND